MADTLLDCYRSIEESSGKMLQAAQAQNWEQVARFETVCAVLISQLRVRGQSEQLLEDQRTEKTRIMQRILHNDSLIRRLAEPVIESLDKRSPARPGFLH
jgi:flagellar protein FliT